MADGLTLDYRGVMRGRRRVELYRWIVTADPPICARGNPVAVLNACERRRRDQECLCRFDVSEVAEDLEAIRADDLIEWWNDDLEPEDVESLADGLARALNRAKADAAPDAVERGGRLLRRLRLLVQAGAGISDEYAEDID